MLVPWKKSYDKPRWHIRKQSYHLANKVHIVKALVFPCTDVKVGPQRRLTVEDLMFLNCGAEQDS